MRGASNTPSVPYYQDDLVTLYHGDCREIMPELDADVVVTDPPYGVGMVAFDDDFVAGVEGFELAPGVRAAVFHSPRRVVEFVNAVPSWSFERLLWMHKSADMGHPWRGWFMHSEAILIFSRSRDDWPDPPTYRGDMYEIGPWGKVGHPNAKPPSVVGDIITKLATPDDLVLDPFAGAGTTLFAAKTRGRRAIGIEIEERYCEIAAKRCSQETLELAV